MNTTWIDLIDMMEGSLHTGNLASKTLLTFANEINLPNIFHILCTKSLYHRSWATRLNAASALNSLAKKFSQFIKRLILTTSSDGELFNLQSINIKSIISNGRELYSDDDLPRNPNKLYGKDWLQYQRKALKKLLGMNIDLAELKLGNNYDSLDNLINVSDVEYNIVESEGIMNRSTNMGDCKQKFDDSGEVWIVRLLRFMISGLLDSKWETRHGCSLGLKEILSGLCPSFCEFESEESNNKNDCFENFYSKSMSEGQKPLNIPLSISEVPCHTSHFNSSDISNNSMSNDPTVSEAASWLPIFLVEDIISSGLCVMVLDRFVDFTITSASVAPVRESCAQLVAYSSSIHSTHFFHQTLKKIIEMCSYEGHWTVNYGGLTALKYVIPICFATTVNGIQIRNSSIPIKQPSIAQNHYNNVNDRDYLNIIIDIIIRQLKESIIDDVICAAAKVVISFRYVSIINDIKYTSQNKNSRGALNINDKQRILLSKLPVVLQACINCLNKANDASTFLPYITSAINSCYHIITNIVIMLPLHEDTTSSSNTSTTIPDVGRKIPTNSEAVIEDDLPPQGLVKTMEANSEYLNIFGNISQICLTYSVVIKTLLRLHITGSTLLQCLEVIFSTISAITQLLIQFVTAASTGNSDSNIIYLLNSSFLFDDSICIILLDSVLILACDIFLLFDSSILSFTQLPSESTTCDQTTSSSCLLTKEEFKADTILSNKSLAPPRQPVPRHHPSHSPSLTNNLCISKEMRKLNDICNQLSITTVKLTSCTIFLYKYCQEVKLYSSHSNPVAFQMSKDHSEITVGLLLIGSAFMTYKTKALYKEYISSNTLKPTEDTGGQQVNLIWKHLLSEYLTTNVDMITTDSTNLDYNRNDSSNSIIRHLYEKFLQIVSGALSDSEIEHRTMKISDEVGGNSSWKDGRGNSNSNGNRHDMYCIDYLVEWIKGKNFLLELCCSVQSIQYTDGRDDNSKLLSTKALTIVDNCIANQDQFIKYQKILRELLILPLLNNLTDIEDQIKSTSDTKSIKKIRKPLFTMTIGTQKVSKYSDNNSPSDNNIDQASQYLKIYEYLSNTLLTIVQAYCSLFSSLPTFPEITNSVNTPSVSLLPLPISDTLPITDIINYFKDEKRIPQKYDNILQIIFSLVKNDLTSLIELAVSTCCQRELPSLLQPSLSETRSSSSLSNDNKRISTTSLYSPILIKLEMYEKLNMDAIIIQFQRYLYSVSYEGEEEIDTKIVTVTVPVLWPPWSICLPPSMMSMLSGKRFEATTQLSCDIIYGVAKQLDHYFFDKLFPLQYLFTTNNENNILKPAWCNFIHLSTLINLLSTALPALTSTAKLAVIKSVRLLGENFYVSFLEFVFKNHKDANDSKDDDDILVSKIADVLVAIVDVDQSFPHIASMGDQGNIVSDVPLTSFTSLRALACTLGTFISSSRYLNNNEIGSYIGSQLAANLLRKLTTRFGAALVRPNESDSCTYSYWLTAALAGISHNDANVRRLCSEALRTLIPFATLATGQLHHDDVDANRSLEFPGMSRASRIMERILTTGSPPLLGSDPLDIPLLLRFCALTGFSLPPGIQVADNTGRAHDDSGAVSNDLRGYQWEGISWITALRRCRLGALLADDMGLGKTLQTLSALALMQLERESEGCLSMRCLVICPAVLVLHWESEVAKFFPSSLIRLVKYANERIAGTKGKHNSSNGLIVVTSESITVDDSSYVSAGEQQGCIITVASYAALRTRSSVLLHHHWDAVVVDESHCCRNPHSQLSLALSELHSTTRIALSGTPVQNQVQELWSIMRFLIPDYLGNYTDFRKNYVIPIEKAYRQKESENKQQQQQHPQQQQQSMKGMNRFQALGIAAEGVDKLQSLHQQVLPFILRRKKEEVLQELPSKTVVDVLCTLSPEQQELYSTMQKGLKLSDAQLEELLLRKKEGINRKGSIMREKLPPLHPLKALLYLSLLSVHPAIVITEEHGSYHSKLLSDGRCSGKMIGLAKVLYESNVVHRGECDARLWEDLYVDDEGSILVTSTEDMDAQLNDLSDDDNEEVEEEICQPPKKRSKKQLVDKKKTTQLKPTKKRPKKGSKTVHKESSNKSKVEEQPQPQPDYNEAAVNSLPPTERGTLSPFTEKAHKCLIFAKHHSALDIIESCVLRRYFPAVSYARLDGSMPPLERATIARHFNNSDTCHSNINIKCNSNGHTQSDIRILLLSTSSCGLGLNLTAADTVIFVEHSWNPFDDLQASDRAHRLGQTRPVTIYRLLAECTVEERVLGIQGRKLNVVSELINEDNSQLMDPITASDNVSKKSLGTSLFSSLIAKDSMIPQEVAGVTSLEVSLNEYESLNVESFLISLGLD